MSHPQHIVHLTDLHVKNYKTGSGEYLREDFYELYLEGFCTALKTKAEKIDGLVITGDFVHAGIKENYSHVTKLIDYLKTALGITDRQIGVCIGNHDLDRNVDFDGKSLEAREAYYKFADPYMQSTGDESKHSNQKVFYKKLTDSILFVSLDATLDRTHKEEKPGKISNEEINKILSVLKILLKDDSVKLLIVASHYPLEYIECPDIPEESDWYEKHFWKSGEHLKRRISFLNTDVKTIWLSGDIHQPSFTQKQNNLYVVSGRFGTESEMYDKSGSDMIRVADISYINRQGTLISVHPNHSAEVFIANVIPDKAGYDPHKSRWKLIDETTFDMLQSQPEIISDVLEKNIMGEIVDSKRFDYEMIVVDEMQQQVALGWVMIDRVFSEPNILNEVIVETSRWLKGKYPHDLNNGEFLMIGLDFWGAIVVNHLSVLLNVEAICLPSRGQASNWARKEFLESDKSKFARHLENKKYILFLADVVSTGKSVRKMMESVNSLTSDEFEFVCVSLICDVKQKKTENLNKYFAHFGTCCGMFRLPIFSLNQLPPLQLLTSKTFLMDAER